MIEEQFVSFDTARMLKEAGFNIPCRGIYITDRTGYYEFLEYDDKQTIDDLCWNIEDGFQYEYLAPTQALAARWLCEVYDIHVFTNYFFEDGKWFFVIVNLKESDETRAIYPDLGDYQTCDEAFEAGLKRVLKLIKK